MKRFNLVSLSVAVAALIMTAGCSSDSDDSNPGASAPTLELGTEVNNTIVKGITQPLQTRPAEDGDSEAFPGQANEWDITSRFSISDGYDDQFDGTLEVTVDGNSFPSDQDYSEMAFYTPLFGSADGIVSTVVADNDFQPSLEGTYTAYLNRGVSKFYQDIDLSNASGDIALNAQININNGSSSINGRFNNFLWQILDENGTIFEVGSTTATGPFNIVDKNITSLTGQSIRLLFAFNSAIGYAQVDAVSATVKEGGGYTEYVTNGDFETGDLTSWNVIEPSMSQNYTGGTRTLGDINVTRSFYTKPNSLWGRWVDVYENITDTEVNAMIEYNSDLGSDGSGIIYHTPGTSEQALTTWDGDSSDRDIGFVIGSKTSLDFTSEDGLGNGNGDEYIDFDYNVTIPANSKISIVNFILLSGIQTGDSATDITAKATEIDNAAKAVYDGMKARNPLYLRGMTQEQIDTIYNY